MDTKPNKPEPKAPNWVCKAMYKLTGVPCARWWPIGASPDDRCECVLYPPQVCMGVSGVVVEIEYAMGIAICKAYIPELEHEFVNINEEYDTSGVNQEFWGPKQKEYHYRHRPASAGAISRTLHQYDGGSEWWR